MSRTYEHEDPSRFWRKVLAILMRSEKIEEIEVTQQEIDEEPIVLLDIECTGRGRGEDIYRFKRQEETNPRTPSAPLPVPSEVTTHGDEMR